ncbi:hypothetical protein Tco_1341739 [Tanacetum coccineum]
MSATRQAKGSAEIDQIVARRVTDAIEAIAIYETKNPHDLQSDESATLQETRVGHMTRDCKTSVAAPMWQLQRPPSLAMNVEGWDILGMNARC